MRVYLDNCCYNRPFDEQAQAAVVFDNGERGVFDCAPYFGQSYWSKLREPSFFKQAYVEYGHLTWPAVATSRKTGGKFGMEYGYEENLIQYATERI